MQDVHVIVASIMVIPVSLKLERAVYVETCIELVDSFLLEVFVKRVRFYHLTRFCYSITSI